MSPQTKEKSWMSRLAPIRELLVAVMDLAILAGSCVLMYYLSTFGRRDTSVFLQGDAPLPYFWPRQFGLLIVCVFLFLLIFRAYASLWEYASSREYLILIGSSACGYVLYLLFSRLVMREFMSPVFTLLAVTVALLAMLAVRLAYRRWREVVIAKKISGERTPIIVVGAGNAGVMMLDEMERNANSPYRPVCFVDDDPTKIGRMIHGLHIEGPIARMSEIITRYETKTVLVAMPSADKHRIREVFELCSSLKCRVRLLPDVMELTEAPLSKQVRDVSIDDLLGRDPVALEDDRLHELIADRVVMVTGGGGSIGSELCRQIARHRPKRLVIVDIYENNAYDIQQELTFKYGNKLDLCVEIASVRDAHKIDRLFQRYQPQVVLHAAAHKHVPLMEHCPEEAIRNNVFGTFNVASAADRFGAERFILISTDKAVNPTNVMGASKRLCEMIVQSFSASKTQFAAVRFGNVLGSNGSVIPLFKRQIANGGPVTLTDRRIIRYFMTIPEAAQLVLLAGAMAQRGEIFVLDMGSPVSILELAENLIRLSGFTPHVDMPIVETGLRPGEKLYEELLTRSENLTETDNAKIFVEREKQPVTPTELEEKFAALRTALDTDDAETLVETMHRIVPTFRPADVVNAEAIADLDYKHAVKSGK